MADEDNDLPDGVTWKFLYESMVETCKELAKCTVLDPNYGDPDNPEGRLSGREWLEVYGFTVGESD